MTHLTRTHSHSYDALVSCSTNSLPLSQNDLLAARPQIPQFLPEATFMQLLHRIKDGFYTYPQTTIINAWSPIGRQLLYTLEVHHMAADPAVPYARNHALTSKPLKPVNGTNPLHHAQASSPGFSPLLWKAPLL